MLLLLLHIFITSAFSSPSAGDTDNDVTHIPDNGLEEQPLLSDGRVPRRYSHDERLPYIGSAGGPGDDVTVQPNANSIITESVEQITT